MSLAGCEINPIDVNFHLQKSLEIVDKNSADKMLSKKCNEIKGSPLIPIKVKQNYMWFIFILFFISSLIKTGHRK